MNTTSAVSTEDIVKVSIYIVTAILELIPYGIILWICGAFLNGIYHAMIPLTLILAFERLITLCFNSATAKWFDQHLLKPCIAFAWLWSCGAIAIFLSPITSIQYDVITLTWGYSTDDLFPNGPAVELAVTAFQNILGATCYLVTILNLTLLAIIIGIYGCLNCAYWNFFYYYLDISYSAFLGNWLWIVQNGMNPFLYLTMNERIRKSFIAWLGCKKKIQTTTITISSRQRSINSKNGH